MFHELGAVKPHNNTPGEDHISCRVRLYQPPLSYNFLFSFQLLGIPLANRAGAVPNYQKFWDPRNVEITRKPILYVGPA